MQPPRGKFLFAWARSRYPNRDSVGYAKSLGMTGIFLVGSAEVEKAKETFGAENVFFWRFPDHFHPHNAAATTRRLIQEALEHGIGGIVLDIENGPLWQAQPERLVDVIRAIKEAREAGLSVGVTTFPYWPFVSRLATETDAWLNVQIYGRSPNEGTRAKFNQWIGLWERRAGEGRFNITVWPHGRWRTPMQAKAYLDFFGDQSSLLLFQSPVPRPGSEMFSVTRDFFRDRISAPPPKEGGPETGPGSACS